MHFLKKGPRNSFKTNGMFKQIGVSSGFHGPNCRGIFFTIFNVLAWGVSYFLKLPVQRFLLELHHLFTGQWKFVDMILE